MSQEIGVNYKTRIPSFSDDASIEEALKVYHYGVDNYSSQTIPANSIEGHFGAVDSRLDDIEATLDVLELTYIEEVSLTADPNTITPESAATVPLTIKGAASQTADLQKWQNSTGTDLATLNATGTITTSGYLGVSTATVPTTTAISATIANSAHKGVVVRAASGQSGNIFEAQNNSGTQIFAVGSAGAVSGPSASFTGAVSSQTLTLTATTGTAPMTVSSTTKVDNLNADLLDGYSTSTTNTANSVVIRDSSGNFSAGTITASLTGNVSGNLAGNSSTSSVAARLGRDANTGIPMTFNWSGQSGQPTWLWGSNDGSNIYVWNPSNFSVNYASSAGNADTVDGYHANVGIAGSTLVPRDSDGNINVYAVVGYNASVGLNSQQVALFGAQGVVSTSIRDGAGGGVGGAANVNITSTGRLRSTTSTQKVKKNISNFSQSSALSEIIDINKLTVKPYNYTQVLEISPVTFEYINSKDNNPYEVGFIAEDIAEKTPELATYDAEGNALYYNINGIVACLLAVVQDQQKEIDELKNR